MGVTKKIVSKVKCGTCHREGHTTGECIGDPSLTKEERDFRFEKMKAKKAVQQRPTRILVSW